MLPVWAAIAAAQSSLPGYRTVVDRVLELTPGAVEKVLLVRDREDEPELHALWVEAAARDRFGRWTYDLWLAPAGGAPEGAVVEDHGPFLVVIPEPSVAALRGAVLDREGDLATGGLVIHEPHPSSPAIGLPPAGELSGEVAERVQAVLERQINPAIAAHGGHAELAAVEQGTAYLRMGGGCQGCGMAAVTLREGIERALREAVPEITHVVDVTDHASGMTPYYESGTN
jgi:Fe/S biogenesis protein NfuA